MRFMPFLLTCLFVIAIFFSSKAIGQTALQYESMDITRIKADQGDPVAQFNLGVMYHDGQGVAQDYQQAMVWYRKAADQGFMQAQYDIGVMFHEGVGVTRDYTEAMKWYRKAANQGMNLAQEILGEMYANGQGVAQNYAEAVKWYRKAAEQGNAIAQSNLGVMYANGWGVAKDNAEAAKWYRKAAEQGNAVAQNNLGVVYANGLGVAQDNAEALKWYGKAADQGYKPAQSNLTQLKTSSQCKRNLYEVFYDLYAKPNAQCIYAVGSYALQATQVTPEGILVRLPGPSDRLIFIYNNNELENNLVDGAAIAAGNFAYAGNYSYESLTGPRKIYSFRRIEGNNNN